MNTKEISGKEEGINAHLRVAVLSIKIIAINLCNNFFLV